MGTGSRSTRWQITAGGLSMLLLGASIWLLVGGVRANRSEEKRLMQRRLILKEVVAAVPAPSEESAAELAIDLARARRHLATLTALLAGTGVIALRLQTIQSPGTRTEAFFDLVGFVEGAREQAIQRGVTLAPTATSFGFSLYAQEGPEPALILPVFRQRLVAQYLLDALFAARPGSLLSMQRERPLTELEQKGQREYRRQADHGAPRAPLARGAGGDRSASSLDYFTPDDRFSTAPTLDTMETLAFRFVFTGETDVLRTFVRRLSQFELPVLVRTIEVQPLAEEIKRAGPAPKVNHSAAASTVLTSSPIQSVGVTEPTMRLVVPKTLSQFTVVVEFIEFAPEPRAGFQVSNSSVP